MDVLECGARAVDAPRFGAGRDKETVVRNPFVVAEYRLVSLTIDLGHGRIGTQLDAVLRVETVGVDEDLLEVALAAQVRLRQGRPLVGPRPLVADEENAPLEAFRAKRLGRLGAGQARTDDQECAVIGHWSVLLSATDIDVTAPDQ